MSWGKARAAPWHAASPRSAITRDGRKRPSGASEHAVVGGVSHRRRAGGHAELGADVGHVPVHGVHAEEQWLGNLGIAKPARHQAQNVDLPKAELLGCVWPSRPARTKQCE